MLIKNIKNKNILVLGAAQSGLSIAKVLKQYGANVIVNDFKEDSTSANFLKEHQIEFFFGSHPLSLIEDRDIYMVIKNPGINYRNSLIIKALELNIPVFTEIEIANWIINSQNFQHKLIAITGSNGKTTVTSLLGKMFKQCSLPSVIAGNIGIPLTEEVLKLKESNFIIAELSSFQLKGTVSLKPNISAILNFVPSHLDYHEDLNDYLNSKKKIIINQSEEDITVLNWDLRNTFNNLKSKIYYFSIQKEVSRGVFLKDSVLFFKDYKILEGHKKYTNIPLLNIKSIKLLGDHNIENVAAAVLISFLSGCGVECIDLALKKFTGVEHRIEFVKSIKEVSYYNDSKSTNPVAASKALMSFNEPIIWIAGGLDRGDNFDQLKPLLKEKVKAAIFFGQTQNELSKLAESALISKDRIYKVSSLEESVKLAYKISCENDVVLLSPACASWDSFKSFEERGSMYKEYIKNL